MSGLSHSDSSKRDECVVVRADVLVARMAAAQHGAISAAQLVGLGLDDRGIARRVAAGRLHRKHHGVYIVGHLALAPFADEAAAVVAIGTHAALSHRSSAFIDGYGTKPANIEVTVPPERSARRAGITIHRARVDPTDLSRREGLPLTNPPRTLRDLSRSLSLDALETYVAQAIALRCATHADLAAHTHGAPNLRRVLAEAPTLTRSKAERLVLKLIRDAGLARPETNVRVHGWEVDAIWAAAKVVLEFQSWRFHGNRAAFERDHRKRLALEQRGFVVVAITWRQLQDEPLTVVARIAAALAGR